MPDDKTADGAKTVNLFLWTAILSAAPLLFLLIDLFGHRDQTSSWFSMRIMAAQMLLQGKRLYEDFFELTQPIVFELIKLTILPARIIEQCVNAFAYPLGLTNIALETDVFATMAVFASACASLALTVAIARSAMASADEPTRNEVSSTILPYLLGFAVSSFIVRFEFGDLQYLFVIALVPWIYTRWLRYKGVQFPKRLSVPVGLVMGLAICFDVPYIVFILALEMVLAILERRLKPVFKPEIVILVAVPILYVLVLLLSPEQFRGRFFQIVMPLKIYSYYYDDFLIYGSQSSSKRVDVLYSMSLVLILSLIFLEKRSLATALSMLGVMGFGLFVMEGNGFTHDLILTIYASTTLAILIVTEWLSKLTQLRYTAAVARKIDPKLVLLAVSLISTAAIANGLENNRQHLQAVTVKDRKVCPHTIEDVIEEFSKPKNLVSVMYDTPGPAYPCLLLKDRQPADYFLYFRPFIILDWLKNKELLTEPLKKFYQEAYVRITVSMDLMKPDLVLVCDDYCREFLTREKIWDLIMQKYEVPTHCHYNSGRWPPREFVGFNWDFSALIRRKP